MKLVKELGGGIILLEMAVFGDTRGTFIKLADIRLNKIRPYEQRQLNYVINKEKFTCRGLHYQQGEFAESKIFRVLQGAIQVVSFNIDKNSIFYKSTFSQVINKPELALWVPRGFATGYCTLEDSTTVLYSSDNDYRPESEAGLRWNDPHLLINDLPLEKLSVSQKDMQWPDLAG